MLKLYDKLLLVLPVTFTLLQVITHSLELCHLALSRCVGVACRGKMLGGLPPSPIIVGNDLSTSAVRLSGEVLSSGAHCWKACCTAC